MNLTTPRKKFLTRNSYLLVIAAWLITISFIIDNYWGSTSTPSGIQKILQKDIQSKEKSFANLCQDRVLLNQLIAHQYNEQTLTDLNKKKYFIFIYSIDTSLQNTPLFWNTQIVQPDESVTSSPDTNNISLLSNGWYVCNKKIFLANDGVSYKIIALIPVKWDYYIQNKYLQNSFAAVKNVENEFTVSRLPDKIAIKDADGKILFYLHENNIIAAGNINQFTLWLRIVAALLTLLFINGAANFYIEKKGLLTGSLILIISFLALRIFSYFIPIPFNLRQAELFDPAVYGSTPVLRSLGDLFINAVLFAWIILFLRYHISEKNLQIKSSSKFLKNVIVFAGAAIMISVTLVAGYIISSLVADSQISFDVINFYTLDIYTIVGFVVLCCLAIGYFFLIQMLTSIINYCAEKKYFLYLALAVAGLIILSFNFKNKYISFDFIELMWLALFVYLINNPRFVLPASKITSTRFIFWIFFFSVSITAIIIFENSNKELENRKHFAENLSNKTDPAGERMMNIIINDFKNNFLSQVFYRFTDPADNKFLKDSLISENFSGYLNKYDTKIYTFDSAENSLSNRDSATYNTLNAIIQTQAKPTTFPNLFYYDVAYDRFNYISKKPVTNARGALQGYIFILSRPKNYKNNALYPELFSKGNANSIESSPVYSFAVYNKHLLSTSYNDYPFPTSIPEQELSINTFNQKKINGYDELWYNAGQDKIIVIAKPDSFFMELLTLFSYLFFSFLVITALFNLGSILIRERFSFYRMRSLLHFTIRNQVHGTIILISLFSFIIIGVATILFFIDRYHYNNRERLSRTIHMMENEVKMLLDSSSTFNSSSKTYHLAANEKLEHGINTLAEIYGADINLYDTAGDLKISSLPLPYNTGIVSTKMDPLAYFHLSKIKDVQFFQEQQIGKLNYLSNYVPVRNESGKEYAYLNIPYFESQNNLKEQISNFLVTIINLIAFIFLIAGLLAFFITNRVTRSFFIITDKMKEINLGKVNEEITWTRKDEIGDLVNEYNKMVRKLDTSAEKLARSEREGAWREMARQVAHEIKNPLTPMKLNLQYLQMAIDTNSPNVKSISLYVAKILVEQIDHLSQIAGDFAQFANIGHSKNQVFNLNEVLTHVISLYSANDKLQILLLHDNEKIMIQADRTQINRLFTNLLQNAIQSVPENRKAEIEIKTKEKDEKVIVSVKDNGIGISEEMKSKIFMPNFTTKTSGTGLGLAMCKGIVEKINGKIWFETEENNYTIFYVELPLTPAE